MTFTARIFNGNLTTKTIALKICLTCFLSSDASLVVAAKVSIARPSFWRANFAILKRVALGNIVTVEHGRMRLSSNPLLISGHVSSCLDA